jgi:prephenate dehydrogenase
MRVGIIGVGLMGGSIALSAIEAGHDVGLYDPVLAPNKEQFRFANIANDFGELAGYAADLYIIASPVSAVGSAGAELKKHLVKLDNNISLDATNHLASTPIVTEIASVKGEISESMYSLFGKNYIPSHPMAGGERVGAEAARDNLFVGSVTILCPDFAPDETQMAMLEKFWRSLGSTPLRMDVKKHDKLVGRISHFPHLLAALLVELISSQTPEALAIAGPGFRDTTRIAAASPSLWSEIFLSNREVMLKMVEDFEESLQQVKNILQIKDHVQLEAFLSRAKQSRDALR